MTLWRRLSAAAAVALALIAPATAGAAANRGGKWSFVSAPGLHPPSVAISTHQPGAGDADIFVAPIGAANRPGHFVGQHGPLILDHNGQPVWFGSIPRGQVAMTFHRDVYRGQPVLVWFQGNITRQGQGHGAWVIANSHYQRIATVHATGGLQTDFHELVLAPHEPGAFLVGWRYVRSNDRRWGGSSNGLVLDTLVQEINIKTGKLMWQWDPLSRGVSLNEPYQRPWGNQWDAFHLNSIDLDAHGNLLIGMRNTWALYYVSRGSKRILWRLGGKRSSFKLEPGVRFAWQHDGRFAGTNMLSVFDDESYPPEGSQSRGEVIRLDTVHRAAHLAAQYVHNPKVLAGSQGNTELLDGGGQIFVGWGQYPYLTEYDRSGNVLWDAHFHGPDESYRAYESGWSGQPATRPAAAAQAANGTTTVYASWNGATSVASWRLLAGSAPQVLVPAGAPVARSGFETAIGTQAPGPYYAVQALDSSGQVIGTSGAVKP